MTFDYARFRAWKISMHRRDLARARAAFAAGNRKLGIWYLTLAANIRESLARNTVRQAAQ